MRQVKPPALLLSYFYFRNKPLGAFKEKLGYNPAIRLDSGAYSAFTKGKGVALTDYMTFIKANEEHITDGYFTLDVVRDPLMSYRYWQLLQEKGFEPIPVYHYGSDEKWLEKYIEDGAKTIGLGGTVMVGNKNEVANWVRMLTWQYPEIDFHLLGSSSEKIYNTCDLHSLDSSTYFMGAINGYPKHIKGRSREAKIERAVYNLEKELEVQM